MKVWFKEAVEPSLLMSFLLVTLGTVVAARNGYFNPSYYILAVIGVTLAQNSVNVLNDYYDYKTGVDARTTKTPFSGGSRFIVSGLIRPQGAFFFGIASLLLATPIAIFFVATRGLPMILIVAVAAISVYFYTTAFARIYLGEFLAGFNLGPLAIIGAYLVQTGNVNASIIAVGLSPGIMIANVLFLNEVPDIEADSAGGRRNLATLLGRRRAVKLYAILETVAVLWIPFSVVLRLTPIATLLALVSLPFAVRAISGSLRQNENLDKLIPALGANIATAYLTISLLTVGYIISGFLAI